ncbi:S-adenosylmethionine:tRNA ribosyltransferase-isomerase [Mariniphaga anaerophila]|uniref:S-adenosylmethionine:tRNA ribosyltransferase-isomerase n=1 Tax=Mariniphaga anaerophila TaxID=1484053 RepID=A0A1M4SJT2_9BACT|nr:S-adenosylmethionine:tRNA ribosyltransferase-isomerase [Mariniphaga anaerophila]SHE32412.1 S-adenosylmethionine:tRNA ribosyltransferase-isomerase [Mariniphaga anaerophila]
MSDFKNIKISDFSYELPDDRIAKYPLKERDSSKLLIWKNGNIKKEQFRNIAEYVPENSMLVFNNTRVIHARLFFRKETGAKIEIFCLEPVDPADHQLAFQQTKQVVWKCMLGNAKKWKEGELCRETELNAETVSLKAKKLKQEGNSFFIEFSWNGNFTFSEIIENSGVLPIPPYLHRETEPADEETYQTVYAKSNGSVAAPTAGLHFTEQVINRLADKNIALREITLHVGAGTFQPVKSETIAGHNMHSEKVIIPKRFIEELLNNHREIIAVGTTSVRSLESIYWVGVQLDPGSNCQNIEVGQWEPYEQTTNITVQKSLSNILGYLENNNLNSLQFSTQIIIVPGYQFKLIQGMVTNFHQPQSTLLLLIGAFLGNDWKKVYDFALKNDFRFLSYGDSNLYLK